MSQNYSSIKFSKENNRFSHNLEDDYGCFVLWKSAKPYREWIRHLLSSKFEILLETEIEWSSRNFHNNASRFYRSPLYDSIPKESHLSEHANKIGDNVFILFVIKDSKPNYSYIKTTSSIIELGNSNIYNLKKQIRDSIYEEIGVQYSIHSTNSIHEFFFQMPLLLGIDLFESLLCGKRPLIKKISKDLEGADGWSSWNQVFEVLNFTNNYVSLDYENLLVNNHNEGIAILTDNYQSVASTLAVTQLSKDGYKGTIQVENRQVPIDIRFIGDKYFDTSWQKDMLMYKVFKNGAFVLRSDMYFFSLLFYCKVHHNEIKPIQIKALNNIAQRLGFTWYDNKLLFNDEAIAEILNGYFKTYNYYYEEPMDKMSFKNKQIIRSLPNQHSIVSREPRKKMIKRTIKKMLPNPVFLYFQKLNSKIKYSALIMLETLSECSLISFLSIDI
jgi:hypothetical protein